MTVLIDSNKAGDFDEESIKIAIVFQFPRYNEQAVAIARLKSYVTDMKSGKESPNKVYRLLHLCLENESKLFAIIGRTSFELQCVLVEALLEPGMTPWKLKCFQMYFSMVKKRNLELESEAFKNLALIFLSEIRRDINLAISEENNAYEMFLRVCYKFVRFRTLKSFDKIFVEEFLPFVVEDVCSTRKKIFLEEFKTIFKSVLKNHNVYGNLIKGKVCKWTTIVVEFSKLPRAGVIYAIILEGYLQLYPNKWMEFGELYASLHEMAIFPAPGKFDLMLATMKFVRDNNVMSKITVFGENSLKNWFQSEFDELFRKIKVEKVWGSSSSLAALHGIAEILPHLMLDRTADILDLFLFERLHREEDFAIARNTIRLHFAYDHPYKLLSLLMAGIAGKLSKIEEGTKLPEPRDEKVTGEFLKYLSRHSSNHSNLTMKAVLVHLNKSCAASLENASENQRECDEKMMFVIETIADVYVTFFSSSRLSDGKVFSYDTQIDQLLRRMGFAMINMRFNCKLTSSFLSIALIWGNVKNAVSSFHSDADATSEYVSKEMKKEVVGAVNLSQHVPFLSHSEWMIVLQRVENFGDLRCRNLVNDLILQKLRALESVDRERDHLAVRYLLSKGNPRWWGKIVGKGFFSYGTNEELVILSKNLGKAWFYYNEEEEENDECQCGCHLEEMRHSECKMTFIAMYATFIHIGKRLRKCGLKEGINYFVENIPLPKFLDVFNNTRGADKELDEVVERLKCYQFDKKKFENEKNATRRIRERISSEKRHLESVMHRLSHYLSQRFHRFPHHTTSNFLALMCMEFYASVKYFDDASGEFRCIIRNALRVMNSLPDLKWPRNFDHEDLVSEYVDLLTVKGCYECYDMTYLSGFRRSLSVVINDSDYNAQIFEEYLKKNGAEEGGKVARSIVSDEFNSMISMHVAVVFYKDVTEAEKGPPRRTLSDLCVELMKDCVTRLTYEDFFELLKRRRRRNEEEETSPVIVAKFVESLFSAYRILLDFAAADCTNKGVEITSLLASKLPIFMKFLNTHYDLKSEGSDVFFEGFTSEGCDRNENASSTGEVEMKKFMETWMDEGLKDFLEGLMAEEEEGKEEGARYFLPAGFYYDFWCGFGQFLNENLLKKLTRRLSGEEFEGACEFIFAQTICCLGYIERETLVKMWRNLAAASSRAPNVFKRILKRFVEWARSELRAEQISGRNYAEFTDVCFDICKGMFSSKNFKGSVLTANFALELLHWRISEFLEEEEDEKEGRRKSTAAAVDGVKLLHFLVKKCADAAADNASLVTSFYGDLTRIIFSSIVATTSSTESSTTTNNGGGGSDFLAVVKLTEILCKQPFAKNLAPHVIASLAGTLNLSNSNSPACYPETAKNFMERVMNMWLALLDENGGKYLEIIMEGEGSKAVAQNLMQMYKKYGRYTGKV